MRHWIAGNRLQGFALVLTLTLLALLLLAIVALSALVKVNGQISNVSAAQSQARQNALLGLSMGRSDLQRYAGQDGQITGMAGITGIPAHATNTTRHWSGVWRDDGSFVRWLTSGAQANDLAALEIGATPIVLVGNGVNGGAGSVGASAANSEHVVAGKIPIVVSETASVPGVPATIGSYAFLVSDEGVKVSAYSPASNRIVPGLSPVITSTDFGSAQEKLHIALASYAMKLPSIISYEQLSLLPTPASALTQTVLQDNFHHVTLTASSLVAGQTFSGAINLNCTSTLVWRSIFESYNSVSGVTPMTATELTSFGTSFAQAFASSASSKIAGGPFLTASAFAASSLLEENLPATVTPAEFLAAVGAMLRVRSDTFRVRAYGEALDPLDGIRIEAVAYCEAVLQRTAEIAPNGLGQKFVVTYFRWLGPDDI